MTRLLVALTVLSMTSAAPAAPASAPAAPTTPSNRAAASAACERAAQGTLRDTRGATATASFDAPPTPLPGAADAGEITLRGAGQARTTTGTRPFSYSCSYDTRSGAVTGVVVREAGTPERAVAAPRVEPDLGLISPAACESAAAGALKRRWPGVAHISFAADTRRLSQAAGGTASLRGQGTATPTSAAPATHFSYDCTVDPRSGRVTDLRVAD